MTRTTDREPYMQEEAAGIVTDGVQAEDEGVQNGPVLEVRQPCLEPHETEAGGHGTSPLERHIRCQDDANR